MNYNNLSFLPSADRPMLVGLLIDVSASMLTSIQNASGESKNRLEGFRDSFKELAGRGQSMSQQGIAGALTPLVKVFAYGFGFGNPLSILMGDKGPKVRDILKLTDAHTSTVPVNELSGDWPRYQKHLEQQIFKAFGDTPMLQGFEIVRERFKSEVRSGKYASLPILFVLSDGEPTDGSPEKVVQTANDMKADGVLIISCYVTSEDITEPRRLYSYSSDDWPSGAKLMFECASALPPNSPFDMYLKEYKWKAESEGRLFTQINQSEVLSEFLNLVLSPVQKAQGISFKEMEGVPGNEPLRLPKTSEKPREGETTEDEDIPIRVFVSYSNQDAKYLETDSLIGYLSGLSREGFSFWCDERISASELWDDRIRGEMERADIALILVSQAFLNSRYCQEIEITNFLNARRKSGLKMFPVILSPCDWKSHDWLASTQFLPRGGQTIETDYKGKGKRDTLFLEILEALRKIGDEVRKQRMEKTSKAIGNFLSEFLDH